MERGDGASRRGGGGIVAGVVRVGGLAVLEHDRFIRVVLGGLKISQVGVVQSTTPAGRKITPDDWK